MFVTHAAPYASKPDPIGGGNVGSVKAPTATPRKSGAKAGALPVAKFARPQFTDFLWTVPLAGLAILFSEVTGHSQSFVLFSGEEELPHLISDGGTFTVGALLAMIACKGVAYSLSLGGFRGGPAFGALFIGAAAGVIASRLPGFELTFAIAVGMAATFVSVLGLPLSSVVLATVLVSKAGYGAEPLIILAVVASHIVTLLVEGGATPHRCEPIVALSARTTPASTRSPALVDKRTSMR